MSDNKFVALLNTLNPQQETVIEGNIAAHEFNLERARALTKNKSLIKILDILAKVNSVGSVIKAATMRTSKRLLDFYPSLKRK